jgi:hypothetical protein
MLRKLLATILSTSVLLVAASPTAAAEKAKPDKRARQVKEGVFKLGSGKNALIALTLKDKTKVAGFINEACESSFEVVDPRTGVATEVAYSSVRQAKGHNLSTGAKIAIGIAIGAGIVLVILLIYLGCCTG